MSEARVTKSDMYGAIVDLMNEAGRPDLAEFAQGEKDALARKAAKAKENAAKKAAESDDLEAAVASALTEEFQVGTAVFAAVDAGDEEFATLGKVRSRLNKLVNAGIAVKEEIAVEGAKGKVMAYRLA